MPPVDYSTTDSACCPQSFSALGFEAAALYEKFYCARILRPGQHFGERELLQNLERQFKATAVEPTTSLAVNKATFEGPGSK
jgi:CRP-like cAMP-binding protein